MVMKGPSGKDLGAIEKGGDGPLPLGFDIAGVLILSARNLLISWLPYFPCLDRLLLGLICIGIQGVYM